MEPNSSCLGSVWRRSSAQRLLQVQCHVRMTEVDQSRNVGIELHANHRGVGLVGASSLEVAGLLAFVADALAGGLRRAVAG